MTDEVNKLKGIIDKLEQNVNEWKIKYKQMSDAYDILDSWADLDHEYIILCDFLGCSCVTGEYSKYQEGTCPNTIPCKECDRRMCGCHTPNLFLEKESSSELSEESSELSESRKYLYYCEYIVVNKI